MMRSTVKDIENQLAEFRKENFSLKLRIFHMEERMKKDHQGSDDEDIHTTNIDLKVQVEQQKQEILEKQQLLMKAKQALDEADQQRYAYVAMEDRYKSQLDQRTAEYQDLEDQFLTLKAKNGVGLEEHYQDLVQDHVDKIKDREEVIEKMNKETLEKDSKMADLKEEIQFLKGQVGEEKIQCEQQTRELEDFTMQTKEKDDIIEKQNVDLEKKQRDIEKKERDIEKKERDIEEKQRDIEKQQRDNEEKQRLIEELQAQIAEVKSQPKSEYPGSENNYESLVEDQQDKLRKKDDVINQLQKDKEGNQRLVQDLEEQLSVVKKQLSEHKISLEEHYEGLLQDHQDQLRNRDKMIVHLSQGIEEKDRLVKECMEKHGNAEQYRDNGKEAIIQNLRQALKERDHAVEEAIEEKFKAIEGKEDEIRDLRIALRERDREMERSKNDVVNLSDKISRLESLLQDREGEIQQYSHSLKATQQVVEEAMGNHERVVAEKEAVIRSLQDSLQDKDDRMCRQADDVLRSSKNLGMMNGDEEYLIQDLNDRLKDRDNLLEEVMAERAKATTANEKATQDLMQVLQDKDQHIKDLNERHNRLVADKDNIIRELEKAVTERDRELQSIEDILIRAEQEQKLVLNKMKTALGEKDRTIEKLVESGREKDRLYRQMQNASSPNTSPQVDNAKLREQISKLQGEVKDKEAAIYKIKSEIPNEAYIDVLKQEIDNKDEDLMEAKQTIEQLQKADNHSQMELADVKRKAIELEDELQAKDDNIDSLIHANDYKESIIKQLEQKQDAPKGRVSSPVGSDSNQEMQIALHKQMKEIDRLKSALHAEKVLYESMRLQNSAEGSHDQGDFARERLLTELAAVEALRSELEDSLRESAHLREKLEKQLSHSPASSGIGSDADLLGSAREIQQLRDQLEETRRWNSSLQSRLEELKHRDGGVGGANDVVVPKQQSTQKSGLKFDFRDQPLNATDISSPEGDIADFHAKLRQRATDDESDEDQRSIPGQEDNEEAARMNILSKLRQKINQLEVQLKESQIQNQTLKRQLDFALENPAGYSNNENDNVVAVLKEQLDQAKTLLLEKEQLVVDKEDEIETLQERLAKKSLPGSGRMSPSVNLMKEHNDIKSQLYSLSQENAEDKVELDSLNQQLTEADRLNKSLKEEIENFQQKLKEAKHVDKTKQQSVRESYKLIKAREDEVKTLRGQVDQLQMQKDEDNRVMQEQAEEVEKLAQQIQELDSHGKMEGNMLQGTVDSLVKENHELRVEVSRLEKLPEEVEKLNVKTKELERKKSHLESVSHDIDNENKKLHAEVNNIKKENRKLQSSVADVQKENEQLRAGIDDVDQDKENLQSELTRASQENDQLRSKVVKAEKDNATLRQKLDKSSSKIPRRSTQQEHLHAQVEELTAVKRVQEEEIKRLKDKLNAAEQTNNLLRRQVELDTSIDEDSPSFNPQLIVEMAQEIERLKDQLQETRKELQDTKKPQGQIQPSPRASPSHGTSKPLLEDVNAALRQQIETMRAELNDNKQKVKLLMKKVQATEATVRSQAEKIKIYRNRMKAAGIMPPPSPSFNKSRSENNLYEPEVDLDLKWASSPVFRDGDDLGSSRSPSRKASTSSFDIFPDYGDSHDPAELKEQIEDLKSQLERSRKVVSVLQNKLRELLSDRSRSPSHSRSSPSDSERDAWYEFLANEEAVDKLRNEVHFLRAELKRYEELSASLHEEQATTESELRTMHERKQLLHDNIGLLQENRRALQHRQLELTNDVQSLDAEKGVLVAERNALEKEKKALEIEKEVIQSEKAALEEQLRYSLPADQSRNIQDLRYEVEGLQQQLEESRRICEMLQDHLEDLVKTLSAMVKQNEHGEWSFVMPLTPRRMGMLRNKAEQSQRIISDLDETLSEARSSVYQGRLSETDTQANLTSDEKGSPHSRESPPHGGRSGYESDVSSAVSQNTILTKSPLSKPRSKSIQTSPVSKTPPTHAKLQDAQLLAELDHLKKKLQESEALNSSLKGELDVYKKIAFDKDESLDVPDGQTILNEHLEEIRMLRQRLEESIITNDKLREQLEEKLAAATVAEGDAVNIYLQQTNVELNQENSDLRQMLVEKDQLLSDKEKTLDDTEKSLDKIKQELSRSRQDTKRLKEETRKWREQYDEGSQLNKSLKVELSYLEKLAKKGSGDGKSRQSPSLKDSSGLDLTELLKEIRHLRIQLERSIETNNALRVKLEQLTNEQLSPNSKATVVTVNTRTDSRKYSPRRLFEDKPVQTENDYVDGGMKAASSMPSLYSERNSPKPNGVDSPLHFQGRDSPSYHQGRSHPRTSPSPRSVKSHGTVQFEDTMLHSVPGVQPMRSQGESPSAKAKRGVVHAIGHVRDYDNLKQQVHEMFVVVSGMEARVRERQRQAYKGSSDYPLLREMSHNVTSLRSLLDEVTSLMSVFWVDKLPSKEEYIKLKQKVIAQENMIENALRRLEATNKLKEGMEMTIIRQLTKTHEVLNLAKSNLELKARQARY
ncbi:uncharacterized protein LOC144440675 [Glandiceps talaboti]